MRRVKINSSVVTERPEAIVETETVTEIDDIDALEMATLLNQKYTSVKELKDAFIVSAESGPMLVYKDHQKHWVGVPFQTVGGHHRLKEDGSY